MLKNVSVNKGYSNFLHPNQIAYRRNKIIVLVEWKIALADPDKNWKEFFQLLMGKNLKFGHVMITFAGSNRFND
jgi:hypothetical protein